MKIEVSAVVKQTFDIDDINDLERLNQIKEEFCDHFIGSLITDPKDILIKPSK